MGYNACSSVDEHLLSAQRSLGSIITLHPHQNRKKVDYFCSRVTVVEGGIYEKYNEGASL